MRLEAGDVPASYPIAVADAAKVGEICHRWRNYLALGAIGPDLFYMLPDKGYIGTAVHTPQRKPPGQRLHKGAKAYNQDINGLRGAVERSIAHMKTFRILHPDYRRPVTTYETAFHDARALHFFKLSSE